MWGEDAKNIMKTGKSDLDVAFGKEFMPPEAMNFFGHLHGAAKAPFKRAIMEYSLQKRLENNIANGVDVTDPMVFTSIGADAYKDGNRAIFMQDNAVSDFYNKKVRELEDIDPKTGEPRSNAKYAGSKALQFLIPFAKIPSNVVAESARNVYGLPVGITQAIYHAFKGDLDNLKPEEKDMIMRNLKKGTLGAAALLYGFYKYNNFGGYYQPGPSWKKKDEDAPWGGAEVGGVKIPQTYMEAPIFQTMQFGATIRKVMEHKIKGEEEGLTPAVWAAMAGLSEQNPLLSQPMHLTKLWGNSYEQKQYLNELVKSTIIPAGVSYAAKATDPADEGSVLHHIFAPENKRKTPKTMGDALKSGIPGLREDLPEKAPAYNPNAGQ
jgi:phage tail protein X